MAVTIQAIWANPFGGPLSYVLVLGGMVLIFAFVRWNNVRRQQGHGSLARDAVGYVLSMALVVGGLGLWEARYSQAAAAPAQVQAQPETSGKCAESCPVKWAKRQKRTFKAGDHGHPVGKRPPKPVRKAMNKWKANNADKIAGKGWEDWWVKPVSSVAVASVNGYCYGYWLVKGNDDDDCKNANSAPGPATKLFTKVAVICGGRAAIVFGTKGRTGLFGTGANRGCVWGALAASHWD